MRQTYTLSNNLFETLSHFTPSGHRLHAPSRIEHEIPEDEYKQASRFLKKYPCKWNKKSQSFDFPFSIEGLFQQILDTQEAPIPNPLAYFPTEPAVLSETLELGGIDASLLDGARFLEPNGGTGAFLDAVKEMASPGTTIHTCELDPFNRQVLTEKGYELVGEDFLEFQPSEPYDVIAMNPPFSVKNRSVWLEHVEHALSMLKPHGVLVAIVPEEGFFNSNDPRQTAFREKCFSQSGFQICHFGAGAFKTAKAIKTVAIQLTGSSAADNDLSWHRLQFQLFMENDHAIQRMLGGVKAAGVNAEIPKAYQKAIEALREVDVYLPESLESELTKMLVEYLSPEARDAWFKQAPPTTPATSSNSNMVTDYVQADFFA